MSLQYAVNFPMENPNFAADDPHSMPLINRKRLLLSEKHTPSRHRVVKRVTPVEPQKWPGLPRGVKFDPSDEDLLCHLLAEIGKGEVEPHPFISEFIVTLEDNGGFGSCHPYTLPGVKQDGSASYFFHRSFKAHVTRTEKRRKILNGDTSVICWHKVGKSKQLSIGGIHTGSKRIMALYMSTACSEKPEKTNWVMHQFHAGIEAYEEGEFVLSKIFYQVKCRPGDKNTENMPIIGLEAVGTDPHAWKSNLTSTEVPAQAAYHDTEAEEINAQVGWRQPGDNDSLPTEETQQENTQFHFLLDHQQKGDIILAVGELRHSQPSCGMQVDPHLTDNAHLADDSLKKVMEDQTVKCQVYRQRGVASSKCDLLEHSILANHASQVMVGSSGYRQENFYREGLNSIHVPDMGAPQEYDSDQLDHLTLQERRNLILSRMIDAQHYCLDLKCTQDEGHPCTYDSIHAEDSEVIPERQRHGAPLSNLESIGKESSHGLRNVPSSSLLDITKNANAFRADQTESETQPTNEGLLHDECYVHHAGHDARKSTASVSIGSPKSVILGEELGSVNANLESRSSAFPAILVAVKAEPVGEIPVTCISESNDATPYSSNMSAPALASSIAPSVLEENVCLDDPSSSRYKFHQKHKNNIRSSDERGISDGRQSFLDQRLVNQNALNPHSSLISIFPLEVKAEPVEGSSINAIPEESIEELASSMVSADFREERISGNCNASYQASDLKDGLCSSNGSQFSTTRFGSLGTVIPESSCLINCCAATGSIPEVDVGASNKLPDSVSPNCLERPKLECVENGLLDPCQTPPSTLPELDVQRTVVKSERFDEVTTDVIDHIPLYVRMHTSKSISDPIHGNDIESSLPTPLSPLGHDLFNSDNVKEKRFSLRRKKKKTATDSVETALEEDAPGLLQVLLDRGITAEEIKLYGETEDDEPLQDSSEDSFEELETLMTKLFSEGPSFFKLSSVRHVKGSKALYCLACLISLIEQARYLRFRHSPVEWGWCRDLQSFIFVFESHNRIVLERPEYGYATYFFELVATLPIDWQIKRLVTAMKLPCCSRSILLENKPLLVGVDLSEGEALVLEEYGWMRNSGIGTLLNFCDRVVHDKKNEMYSLEWRGKIAKLLMRGHDSGRTVLSHPPKRAEQYFDEDPEFKLEPVFE